MKKIFRLSSVAILSVVFMAVKCGEDEIPRPDSLDPITVTLEKALSDDTLLDITIKISDDMYFSDPEGTQFNSSGSNGGGSREIKNCDGVGGIVVFTSTDREFAYQDIPTTMGPIIGILSEYQGVRQLLLRSIDDVSEMTKEKCEEKTTVVTISQFNTGLYEGQVVKLDNVQFKLSGEDGVFNGTDSNGGGSRTLTDCDGNELTVFTDKTSPLSTVAVPELRGTLIGEASSFGTTKQLLLRSVEDFAGMTEVRCVIGGPSNPECTDAPTTTYLSKDFNDGSLTSGGWSQFNAIGTIDWKYETFDGKNYATITNLSGGMHTAAETWLISPVTDISSSTNPLVSFINLKNQSGDPLKLMISTDYSSGDPALATWTDLSSSLDLDTDETSWTSSTCSSNIDISAQKSSTTTIAIVYEGSNSSGSVWQVDDILIKE